MTWLEIILSLATIVLLVLWLAERLEKSSHVADAIEEAAREWRLAMAYVAAGKAHPYEALFANAFIGGHETSIRRQFPDYSTFRAIELERMEEDDA